MSSSVSPVATPSKGWSVSLWIVQVLLALAFGMAGLMKSTQPIELLSANVPWAANVPPAMVRFIGISELLGGLGMILPAATRILPVLTPAAGAGLVTVMFLAAGYHVLHAEYVDILVNLVLGLLAGFVTWGRLKKAPIRPRQ